MAIVEEIKYNGKPNNLIDRIIKDGRLGLEIKDIEGILVSSDYTGFAEEQTENFIKDEIAPILSKYKYDIVEKREELKV